MQPADHLVEGLCQPTDLVFGMDDRHLHIEILPDFFGEEKATAQDMERALAAATIANIVGELAVGHAISLGYVDRENVLIIKGVPCAQMVLM